MLLDEVTAELERQGVRCAETRFVNAPTGCPYVIWDASVVAGGADYCNPARTFSAVLTLVYRPEHAEAGKRAGEALESALDGLGMPWTRQYREWNEDEHCYMTDYETSWAEKAPRR